MRAALLNRLSNKPPNIAKNQLEYHFTPTAYNYIPLWTQSETNFIMNKKYSNTVIQFLNQHRNATQHGRLYCSLAAWHVNSWICGASANNGGIKRRIGSYWNTTLKTWAIKEGGLLEISVSAMSSVLT